MSQSFRRRQQALSTVAILAVIVVIALWRWYGRVEVPPNTEQPRTAGREDVRIERTVDGDTFKLAGGERVRLIGVDTPESVKPDSPVEPWGPEAGEFTKRFLGYGNVRLEFDREKYDDYGRLLAYVYAVNPTTGREELLNEELLRAGLAHTLLKFPYSDSMKRRFRQAEEEARAAKRGIWSSERGQPTRPGTPPNERRRTKHGGRTSLLIPGELIKLRVFPESCIAFL